jgi:hypothetical protein
MLELIVIAVAVASYLSYRYYRKRKRQALKSKPFPDAWRQTLEQNMPLYRRCYPRSCAGSCMDLFMCFCMTSASTASRGWK